MDCPACGAETLAFPVGEYREYLPGDEPGAALCTRCLRLHPAEEPPPVVPDFAAVSDAFPSAPDAAVPFALLVGLLDSLAQYRSEIGALLDDVERAGTDPFLSVDRLARDPDIDPAVDLAVRRRQLEQFV
jgi:hypothetical protein